MRQEEILMQTILNEREELEALIEERDAWEEIGEEANALKLQQNF